MGASLKKENKKVVKYFKGYRGSYIIQERGVSHHLPNSPFEPVAMSISSIRLDKTSK